MRGAGWLSLATVAVSAANYGFSLVMARVLEPGSFVSFVAVQSLLLVVGTGVMAAVPWVVARHVALASRGGEDGPRKLGEYLSFGLSASVAQGVLVATLTAVVGWFIGGTALAVVSGVAGFALSMVAAPVGFLQGQGRFGAIAILRLGEAALRIAVGLALGILMSGTASGAVAGFPVGSLALVAVGLLLCRAGFPLRRPERGALLALLRQSASLGVVQILLAALGAVDTVVAATAGLSPSEAYTYQIAALLGRVPMFLSIAIAQALYPSLAATDDDRTRRHDLTKAISVYLRAAWVVVLGAWTVPASLLTIAAGRDAAGVAETLRVTSLTGLVVGLLTIVVAAYQARMRSTTALRLLVPFALAQPVVLFGAAHFGELPFALSTLVLVAVLTAIVLVRSRGWWSPEQWRISSASWRSALAVVVVSALLVTDGGIILWVPGMIVISGLLLSPCLPARR